MSRNKQIYEIPVNDAKRRLDSCSNKRIFLVGGEGTGKSLILNESVSRNADLDNLIINVTAVPDKYISILDKEIADLYQIIMVIKRMINYLKNMHINKYNVFVDLENQLGKILNHIDSMYQFGCYDSKYRIIGEEICKNPGILLESLLIICAKHIDYQTITVLIDNFDSFGYYRASESYQKCMYNTLSQYLRTIMTVSDKEVINNPKRKEELSNNNDLVTIDYSKDVNTVKEILDSIFIRESILNASGNHLNKVGLLLSDETIALMIEKTNGNLFDMIKALKELYKRLNELSKEEYDAFVINYIDKVINKNPIFTGDIKRERKLFIK